MERRFNRLDAALCLHQLRAAFRLIWIVAVPIGCALPDTTANRPIRPPPNGNVASAIGNSELPASAAASRIRLVSAVEVGSEPSESERATGAALEPNGAHPVDLVSVLGLANGQNPQVAFARERIQEAFTQLQRAEVLWLPSLRAGANYTKHEGAIQSVAGGVFNTSRGAFYTGFGAAVPGAASPAVPGLFANFQLTDAIFQPRIAKNVAAARECGAQAATNDALLDTALAYLELLRAYQEIAIAEETINNTRQLADLTADYANVGKGTEADNDRVQTDLSVRKNELRRSQKDVQVASARLAQLLSIDPSVALKPQEPTVVPIELTSPDVSVHDLVAQGLTSRPEVSESRHLVKEAVERLKREQYAPLIPSVLLGVSYGGYGGGLGSTLTNFDNRFDADAMAYWEVRQLGFGERAARGEARSRIHQAQFREVAALDRVAREVVEAKAQVDSARDEIATAREGVKTAINSYGRNFERIRNVQGLPIEVLQSIQALAQARREYLRAVIDYDSSQFRLHRALGWPTEINIGPE